MAENAVDKVRASFGQDHVTLVAVLLLMHLVCCQKISELLSVFKILQKKLLQYQFFLGEKSFLKVKFYKSKWVISE